MGMNSYHRAFFQVAVLSMKRLILIAFTMVAFSISTMATADSDDPPLFVTKSGSDSGDCQSELSPCQSIGYALDKVGKNGRIRVGDGSYELTEVADVIYLLSGAIDVRGSYAPGTKSTLVGVPHELAGELATKGFRVIADSKASYQAAIQTQQSLKSNSTAISCDAGFAGIFPCNNVDLLAHIADRTPSARGADIWGFMDLNTHREYAIVGYSTGTAVYDVTHADEPREVGFVDGQSTTWRDIKIHQFWNATDNRWNSFAYITADNSSDGLFIIDLSELPQRVMRSSYSSDFTEAHNVYLTDTDFSTGLSITGAAPTMILAGSNLSDGRFRAYSLADPASPAFIHSPSTPADQSGIDRLYMHDAASMVVTDDRKDTQCVNAAGSDHCDILFDFNESTVDIWDITDPADSQRLSQTPYTNADYVHSGWWSEDKQTLFVQDETDERDRGLATTLRAFSISNLGAPTLTGVWTGPTTAIDHNGFVRGNRYYMSNYARGLTVLDITNVASPVLVGRFDTYPASDDVGFPGNWGAYPFFPSGNIALSDIDSGFYMVADNTLSVAEGMLSFSAPAYGADEAQSLDIAVQRSGGSQGAASVEWEVIGATADFDDISLRRGTLNWSDGDGNNRTIVIGLTDDGLVEGLERVFVKLHSPTGGATLSTPSMASAYISDSGDSPFVEFSAPAAAVEERGFATAVAVVKRSGSATGAVSVEYSVTGGDATSGSDYTGATAGTLSWTDGDADPKWIEFPIVDDGIDESDEVLEVTLSNANGGSIGANSTLQITIGNGFGSNNSPNSIAGSSQTVAGGASVTLDGSSSNDPDGDVLNFSWSQTTGPSVALSNANTSTASFTAPTVNSDTLLRFQLDVTDSGGLVDSSTATVTITSASANASGSGGGSLDLWLIVGLFSLSILKRKGAP
jgi:choice-of-anchor B domain-containing protein